MSPSARQSAALAAREEKLFKQRDTQRQQAQELSQRHKALTAQEAAGTREQQRLQGWAAELAAAAAAVEAREAAAAAQAQVLAADAAALQQQRAELQAQLLEVQVGSCSLCPSLFCVLPSVTTNRADILGDFNQHKTARQWILMSVMCVPQVEI